MSASSALDATSAARSAALQEDVTRRGTKPLEGRTVCGRQPAGTNALAPRPCECQFARMHRFLACSYICIHLLSSGCASPPPEPTPESDGPLTRAELDKIYKRATDPRTYWITVRGTDSGQDFEGAHRLHPGQGDRLKFVSARDSSYPIVKIEGDAFQKFTALIDTSSAENWVDLQTARSMELVPLGPPGFAMRPVHVVDEADGLLFAASKVRLGKLHIETGLFFVRNWKAPLSILDRGVTDPHPTVVVGMRFLRPFKFVSFNFPDRAVMFSASSPYEPNPERLLASVPSFDDDGLLLVEGSINGRPTRIALDSAGAFSLTGPDLEGDTLRHLSLGDLVLRDVPIQSTTDLGLPATSYPRVGLDLLSKFIMTIDEAEKVVHFERPAKKK